MSQYEMIPVSALRPPRRPMREASLYEGLEGLKDSMQSEGLHQPIGVIKHVTGCEVSHEERDGVVVAEKITYPAGTYEVVWGSRRALAAREMGWQKIAAMVHSPGEVDPTQAMGAENIHRTQVDPVEEAAYYRDQMMKENITAREVARRLHIAPGRVERLLDILEGDPAIRDAVRMNRISQAQAMELNLIADEIGRAQGLHYAAENGLSARFIRAWREEREKSGVSASAEAVAEVIRAQPKLDYRTLAKCQLHEDYVDMMLAPPRIICDACWELVLAAVSAYTPPH